MVKKGSDMAIKLLFFRVGASLLAALSAMGLLSADFIVHNYTDRYIFVAQLRTIAGTRYTKAYVDATWTESDITMYAIDAAQAVTMPSDSATGLRTYDRVLWVSDSFQALDEAVRSKSIQEKKVYPIYLGRKQSGAKYIVPHVTKHFILVDTEREAAKVRATAAVSPLHKFNRFLIEHGKKPAENAQLASIKRAFKQASLKLHPDKNPDPEATAIYQEMSNLYEAALKNA